MMASKKPLFLLLIVGAIALARVYASDTPSGAIGVVASVAAYNDFEASLYNISDNSPASSFSYPVYNISAPPYSGTPNEYMAIKVADNAVSWRLRVFTNNFQGLAAPDPAVWKTNSYGGLVNISSFSVVSMGWYCSAVPVSPVTGNPAAPSITGWKSILDLADTDDPSTPSVNESFAARDASGYANIAYGSGSYTRIVRPNVASQSVTLNHVYDWFYLYLEADFQNKSMNGYGGTISLELINQ